MVQFYDTSMIWLIAIILMSTVGTKAFEVQSTKIPRQSNRSWQQAHGGSDTPSLTEELACSSELVAAASKFKIVTCMSTSCSKRRKNLGMDSLSTFSAFYTRSRGDGDDPLIIVEEGPCLGACKMAPCVAVEHDDFVGNVALEGMTDREFMDRV